MKQHLVIELDVDTEDGHITVENVTCNATEVKASRVPYTLEEEYHFLSTEYEALFLSVVRP